MIGTSGNSLNTCFMAHSENKFGQVDPHSFNQSWFMLRAERTSPEECNWVEEDMGAWRRYMFERK